MRVVKASRQDLTCPCGSKNFEPVGKKVYRCKACNKIVTTTKNEFTKRYAKKLEAKEEIDVDFNVVERMLQ